ncbi:hypothetical protein PTKIN_Ptkin02bG0133100 [Pterospermum kingtungense]
MYYLSRKLQNETLPDLATQSRQWNLVKDVNVDGICYMYGVYKEDILHNLFFCHFFEFWKQRRDLELAMSLGWSLWLNRNKCLHLHVYESVNSIVAKVQLSSVEFKAANQNPVAFSASVAVVWIAPFLGHYKLNVDAGLLAGSRVATCGVVLRDYSGQVILSTSISVQEVFSALHAELHAILFGLRMVYQFFLLAQLVESDSKQALLEVSKGRASAPE